MSELFRQEVIDRQTSRHLGDVILAAPKTLFFYFSLVLALFIITIGILGFGSYAVSDELSGSVKAVLPSGEYEVSLTGNPDALAAIETGQSLSVSIAKGKLTGFTVEKAGPIVTIPVDGGKIYASTIRVKPHIELEPLNLAQHVDIVLKVRRRTVRSLIFGDAMEGQK
ncbi:MAG: hypothetical protein HKN36_05540 [Hellea sp.]|nr:hypothetical protein [Hellea sp.]